MRPCVDGILQRAGDVLLPDHVGELLRTVFARQNLITHGEENLIIRSSAGERNGARESIAS